MIPFFVVFFRSPLFILPWIQGSSNLVLRFRHLYFSLRTRHVWHPREWGVIIDSWLLQ